MLAIYYDNQYISLIADHEDNADLIAALTARGYEVRHVTKCPACQGTGWK